MKIKCKKILGLATAAVMLTTAVVPASAIQYDNTKTYYVYQEMTIGSVVMYPTYASGSTYCELMKAAKSMYTIHSYHTTTGYNVVTTAGAKDKYITNGYYELTYNTKSAGKLLDYSHGARAYCGVAITEYIKWTSDGCDDNPQVGNMNFRMP